MKKLQVLTALCACLLLAGCASLLEREYSVVEPHSSKFWESEAAGTLRAENYQDIVNDLLLLIGEHTERATIRLYNFEEDMAVGDILDRAITEIRHETPLGAYAVEFITSSYQSQRGYYEISVQISYRRTIEQIQTVVNATSTEALGSLLETALDNDRSELAVRIGYWRIDDHQRVRTIMEEVRQNREIGEETPWAVLYYPDEGPAGLVEFILKDAEQYLPEELPASEDVDADGEGAEGEASEDGEDAVSEETAAQGGETAPEAEAENSAEMPIEKNEEISKNNA